MRLQLSASRGHHHKLTLLYLKNLLLGLRHYLAGTQSLRNLLARVIGGTLRALRPGEIKPLGCVAGGGKKPL
jgi:hypothetical protein